MYGLVFGKSRNVRIDTMYTKPHTGPTIFKRSWQKYGSDCRVFFHNSIINVMVYFSLALVTWYVLNNALVRKEFDPMKFTVFIDLLFLHFLIPLLFERRYDP